MHHVTHCLAVIRPFLAVAPVVFGDLVALERDLFTLLKALQLGLLIDGQPELDDHHTRFRELFFKIVDFGVSALPVRVAAKTLDPLDQHAAIPRAVEDGEFAARRYLAPEPPQIRLRSLVLSRRSDRHDGVLTRVQCSGNPSDSAAFTCCVIAFEHGQQCMALHAFVAHVAGQPRLLGDQLFLIVVLAQLQAQVEAVEQRAFITVDRQRPYRERAGLGFDLVERSLHALQQQASHRQAAVIGVHAFDHVPRRVLAAGAAQHSLAEAHELAVGPGLLPVQRADAPAVQRVILEGLEAQLHLFFGQVKPELEDQRAFVTEHLFKAFGTADGLIEYRILVAAMHTILKHLAVPVAKENAHAPLGRQLSPVPPGRRVRQFFVGLLVEGAHLYQARVHPFVEQFDGLALASAFYAIDQHNDLPPGLLVKVYLRFQQRLAQLGQGRLVGFIVNGMTDFSRFKHAQLLMGGGSMNAPMVIVTTDHGHRSISAALIALLSAQTAKMQPLPTLSPT
ncbi:hypothetical protein ALQ62_05520 [Pseudomonas coronafaciens pv. zizaniae]|nr:hypothetical protein ALQ62_05520 [Pseudomonas coronafaciens pv. zizaniae]